MTSGTSQLPKSQLAGPLSVLLATRYDLRAAADWDRSSSSLEPDDTFDAVLQHHCPPPPSDLFLMAYCLIGLWLKDGLPSGLKKHQVSAGPEGADQPWRQAVQRLLARV